MSGTVEGEASTSAASTAVAAAAAAAAVEKPDAATGKELSNAEKKKLAKAEKQAKRAATKGGPVAGPDTPVPTDDKKTGKAAQQTSKSQHKVQISQQSATIPKDVKSLPQRRRPSQAAPLVQDALGEPQQRQVAFFSHLAGQSRRRTLAGTSKDVHPAIQALGMQITHYQICGSHARCAATLLALKTVIEDYKTPHGTSLPRDLSSHHMSPQLSFLKACRPFSITQSNAIRWLKNVIAKSDPSTPEPTAKADICSSIDDFLKERLTVADRVIGDSLVRFINDGDNVLTFAKSAVVTSGLIAAAKAGRKFRVTVVDSRPLLEGRNLARTLVHHGVAVSYCMLTGINSEAALGTTKCLLGAHAILGNGSVYSRAGTAMVALTAKRLGIPVAFCAETIKFTDRITLDSIVMNELAPEDELRLSNAQTADKDALYLNPMFDVTPAKYISMIMTELGEVPPNSATVAQRMSAGAAELLA